MWRVWCGDFVGSWPAVVFTFARRVACSVGSGALRAGRWKRDVPGRGRYGSLVTRIRVRGDAEAGSLLRRGLPAGRYPVALNSRWPAAMRGKEKLAEHYDQGLWCGAVRVVGVKDVAAERVQVEVSAAVAEPVLFPRPAGHTVATPGEWHGGGVLNTSHANAGRSVRSAAGSPGRCDATSTAPG